MPEQDKLRKLKKALIGGRLDFDEVVEKLRNGEMQWHEFGEACGITVISVSGRFKTLYVVAVAGSIEDVPGLGHVFELFGKAMGCQAIEADGRLGFKSLFEDVGRSRGYKQISVKYRKDL